MDLLTGQAGKTAAASLKAQQDQIGAAQRQSLAQLAAEQGQLDQASAGGGRRKRGGRLLTFINEAGGQATLG